MVSIKDENVLSAPYLYPTQVAELTPLLLGLDPRLFILLDTIKEDLATLRVLDMLDTDVYTLLNISISDAFVDEDANRPWADIVDDACSAIGALSTQIH